MAAMRNPLSAAQLPGAVVTWRHHHTHRTITALSAGGLLAAAAMAVFGLPSMTCTAPHTTWGHGSPVRRNQSHPLHRPRRLSRSLALQPTGNSGRSRSRRGRSPVGTRDPVQPLPDAAALVDATSPASRARVARHRDRDPHRPTAVPGRHPHRRDLTGGHPSHGHLGRDLFYSSAERRLRYSSSSISPAAKRRRNSSTAVSVWAGAGS